MIQKIPSYFADNSFNFINRLFFNFGRCNKFINNKFIHYFHFEVREI